MSLNKLLCKYLDHDGRGYVTIGDLITVVGILAALLLIVAMYIHGVILYTEDCNMGVLTEENRTVFDGICFIVFIVGTTFLIAAAGAVFLTCGVLCFVALCDIKIAKCDRKEGDEHNGST